MNSQITIPELKEILESNGVKPSIQRLNVCKYIIEQKNHPSVDKIFQNLVGEIPTLSKTTVYNTLKLLTEKGIITSLSIDDIEVKYDYIEKAHAHFYCSECEHIYDIELDTNIFNTKTINNHNVADTQINFKGVCNKCKQ